MTSVLNVQAYDGVDFLDPSVIDGLSSIMPNDAVQSLVIDMERDVRERLMRLSETQVATGSLDVIAQDAHDLRSMGGNFGLSELALHARTVERAARSQCLDTVRASTPVLISIGHQSLKALRDHRIFENPPASEST